MAQPNILILTGYGINCDEETKYAFEVAGGKAEIVHINDLIDGRRKLSDYQILAFPGGFSYGDDTGSGNALANKIRNNYHDEVKEFVGNDTLMIGICNGFQTIARLGLLPGMNGNYEDRKVALVHNSSARYLDRWVDLKIEGDSPWMKGIDSMSIPIAHAEGKFYADKDVLKTLNEKGLVAVRYFRGDACEYQDLVANPNGSLDDIAGITDETGRLLGMMPHPERAINFTHLLHWTFLREEYKRQGKEIPSDADGLKIFENGVKYFE